MTADIPDPRPVTVDREPFDPEYQSDAAIAKHLRGRTGEGRGGMTRRASLAAAIATVVVALAASALLLRVGELLR